MFFSGARPAGAGSRGLAELLRVGLRGAMDVESGTSKGDDFQVFK